MTTPTTDPESAMAALQRAVVSLALEPLHRGMNVRPSPAVPTGAWVHDPARGTSEVLIAPRLCLDLPIGPLAVLVLHELLHAFAFGASRLPPGFDHPVVRNLALDAVIDKLIRLGPRSADLVALNDAVRADAAPLCLVLHPSPPPARLSEMTVEMRAVHQALWSNDRIPTVEESYARFRPLVAEKETSLPSGLVVGGIPTYEDLPDGSSRPLLVRHRPPTLDPEDSAENDGDLATITSLVAQASGASLPDARQSALTELRIEIPSDDDLRAARFRDMTRHHETEPQTTESARKRPRTEIVKRPYLMRPTRSELVREAAGIGGQRIYRSNIRPRRDRLREIYVDCSASMRPHAGRVAGVLRGIRDVLPEHVWVFDVEVRRADAAQFCDGISFTGGATSFDAVVHHGLTRGLSEMLLLTDGEGELSEAIDARRRALGLRVDALCFGRPIRPGSLRFCTRVECLT